LPASTRRGKGEPLAATVTVADRAVVPPVPVQLRPKLVVAVSAPVLAVPPVPLLPLQPPDAVQSSALLVLQVSVEDAPLAMLVGLAENVTVGAGGVTVTVADWLAVPPAPVQLSVKVVVAVSAPVLAVPLVPLLPLQPPDAVHAVGDLELVLGKPSRTPCRAVLRDDPVVLLAGSILARLAPVALAARGGADRDPLADLQVRFRSRTDHRHLAGHLVAADERELVALRAAVAALLPRADGGRAKPDEDLAGAGYRGGDVLDADVANTGHHAHAHRGVRAVAGSVDRG